MYCRLLISSEPQSTSRARSVSSTNSRALAQHWLALLPLASSSLPPKDSFALQGQEKRYAEEKVFLYILASRRGISSRGLRLAGPLRQTQGGLHRLIARRGARRVNTRAGSQRRWCTSSFRCSLLVPSLLEPPSPALRANLWGLVYRIRLHQHGREDKSLQHGTNARALSGHKAHYLPSSSAIACSRFSRL